MSTINPTVNPELIAKVADVLDERRHNYDVNSATWKPYCICGWSAEEPYDVAAYDRHLAVEALEAAAPLIAAQALRDLADEWREAYSADIFPCSTDDLRHINATSGPNSTAKVAAHFARHWADVLSARTAQVGGDDE